MRRGKLGTWKRVLLALGLGVTVSALGVDSVRESCASRAFVRQSPIGDRTHPQERFVSFVMDL